MMKLIRSLRDKQGVTSIEFAFLAPIMLILILGIIEIGLVVYVNTALEGATAFGARVGKTGFTSGGLSREDYIRQEVTRLTSGLLNPANLEVRVKVYPTFNSINFSSSGKPPFDAGSGGDIVLYQTRYEWNMVTPIVSHFFPQPLVISASTPVRNEPF